jgi:hypothetical protein
MRLVQYCCDDCGKLMREEYWDDMPYPEEPLVCYDDLCTECRRPTSSDKA